MALFGGHRDIKLFNTISRELMNNIIDTSVDIFKAAIYDVKENLYGEVIDKYYKPSVRVSALINHDDQMTDSDDFGTDINQSATFNFLKDIVEWDSDIVLEVGDIIHWDNTYWEIDSVVENQYIAGKNERTTNAGSMFGNSHSIICQTHMTRRSIPQLEKVRTGINNIYG